MEPKDKGPKKVIVVVKWRNLLWAAALGWTAQEMVDTGDDTAVRLLTQLFHLAS